MPVVEGDSEADLPSLSDIDVVDWRDELQHWRPEGILPREVY
jgi:hypothetical protein